jgi:hypothetical protein
LTDGPTPQELAADPASLELARRLAEAVTMLGEDVPWSAGPT